MWKYIRFGSNVETNETVLLKKNGPIFSMVKKPINLGRWRISERCKEREKMLLVQENAAYSCLLSFEDSN